MRPSGRLLHFVAGERRFALPVSAISEIREIQEVTPVPGTPDAIAGLAELRGRVVTLLDLARIFELAAPKEATGLLAVQFAEPLSHLALLVPAPIHALRTDAGAGANWGEATAPAGADAQEPGEDASRPDKDPEPVSRSSERMEAPPEPAYGSEGPGAREAMPARPQPSPHASPGTTPGGAEPSVPDFSVESRTLGREVMLAGGEPVFLIDPEALIQHSVRRVRDRFRVHA